MLQTVINNLKHTVFNLFVLLLAGILCSCNGRLRSEKQHYIKQRRCPSQNLALNATTGGNRGEPSNPVPRQEMSLQNKSDLPGIRYIDSWLMNNRIKQDFSKEKSHKQQMIEFP
jgi:hypothetical protein